MFARHWLRSLVFVAIGAAVFACGAAIVMPASGAETVLLDFYSQSCTRCLEMRPIISQLQSEGYRVMPIDVEAQPDLARQYGVGSLPCFVVLESGKEVDRVSGKATAGRLKSRQRKREAPPATATGEQNATPHPAWRFEQPKGYRAAVVRVYSRESRQEASEGSGTLVRWNGRVVVLTAAHVVRDAKDIVVRLSTGQVVPAKILKLDTTWDCAVLAPGYVNVAPVDLEMGDAALLHDGDRLETCGLGGDDRLAVNSGLFLGYCTTGSSASASADWMAISGYGRSGDSGGAAFNSAGRLVGVIWGGDAGLPTREFPTSRQPAVYCVQAGRLHLLLDAAVPPQSVQQQSTPYRLQPTPPKPSLLSPKSGPLVAVPPLCGPECDGCTLNGPQRAEKLAADAKRNAALPWRDHAEQRDKSQSQQLDQLIELERIRAGREAQAIAAAAAEAPAAEEPPDQPSPLMAGLSVLAAVVLGFGVYFAAQKS